MSWKPFNCIIDDAITVRIGQSAFSPRVELGEQYIFSKTCISLICLTCHLILQGKLQSPKQFQSRWKKVILVSIYLCDRKGNIVTATVNWNNLDLGPLLPYSVLNFLLYKWSTGYPMPRRVSYTLSWYWTLSCLLSHDMQASDVTHQVQQRTKKIKIFKMMIKV